MEIKELLENVQKRAVKMISGLAETYQQMLRALGLSTLEKNRSDQEDCNKKKPLGLF